MSVTLLALSALFSFGSTDVPASVWFVEGGTHVLLERVPGAECVGPPRLAIEGTAIRCAAAKVEADPHAAWVGRALRLLGGSGACTAKVVEIEQVARFDPHFPLHDKWMFPKGERPPEAPVAREAWSRAGWDDRFIAGRLELSDAKACAHARWAELTRRPKTFRPGAFPSDRLQARALARFRAHAGFAAVQARYDLEDKAKGTWDTFDGASPWFRTFKSKHGGHYVFAGARVGGCGEFDGDFWVLWRVVDGRWTEITNGDAVGGWFYPEGMLESGARPAFLGQDLRIAPRGKTYEVVEDASTDGYICPC